MRLGLLAAAVAAAALAVPDDAEARSRRSGGRSQSRGYVSAHTRSPGTTAAIVGVGAAAAAVVGAAAALDRASPSPASPRRSRAYSNDSYNGGNGQPYSSSGAYSSGETSAGDGVAFGGGIVCGPETPPGTLGCPPVTPSTMTAPSMMVPTAPSVAAPTITDLPPMGGPSLPPPVPRRSY